MSTFTTDITPPPPSTSSQNHCKRKYTDDENHYISSDHPSQFHNPPIIDETQLKKNLKDEIDQNTEWPQFIHPDGGVIKITPWGSLRQFNDPKTGEALTKFEDFSFEDFNQSVYNSDKLEKIYSQHQYTPDTPISIGNNRSDRLNYSPTSEVESYVIDGYNNSNFQQEHENYFGMNEDNLEEFDTSYQTNEDDEMR